MRLRSISLVLLAAAGCSRTPRAALPHAVEYLWSQQASDGGWHSRTYGLLRSGQALTPFVLDALLQAEAQQRVDVAIVVGVGRRLEPVGCVRAFAANYRE